MKTANVEDIDRLVDLPVVQVRASHELNFPHVFKLVTHILPDCLFIGYFQKVSDNNITNFVYVDGSTYLAAAKVGVSIYLLHCFVVDCVPLQNGVGVVFLAVSNVLLKHFYHLGKLKLTRTAPP